MQKLADSLKKRVNLSASAQNLLNFNNCEWNCNDVYRRFRVTFHCNIRCEVRKFISEFASWFVNNGIGP